jgi:hypothetical protein
MRLMSDHFHGGEEPRNNTRIMQRFHQGVIESRRAHPIEAIATRLAD